jgi:hypothetical protein
LCDFRPAFGDIFAEELTGYEYWGHCDLDVLFGRIRDHLPSEAFDADKILFQGNFALYRNTPDAARWYRHEVGRISYRDVFTDPAARHFDEWGGIYYILEDLGVRCWQQPVIVRFEKQPVSGAYFVLSHDAVYCLSPAHCVAPDLVDACSNGGSPTFRGDNCRW